MNPGRPVEKKPLRVFSDLHLAHPGCRIRSVDHLAPLFEGAGTVVFNGDTVEQRHSKMRDEGEERLEELDALLSRLEIRAHYLRGNHDPEISEQDHLDLADGRVLVTHGDAFFRHLSPWNRKVWKVKPQMEALREEMGEERLMTDLSACFEYVQQSRYLAAGREMVFQKGGPFPQLRSLARLMWPPARPFRILHSWLTIPRNAHAFARRYRPEAEVLLFGHTHLPGTWKREERVAINTGGFISLFPARCVEIANGELVVRKVLEREDRYQLGPEVKRISLSG